jgi:secreted PhoX family phosphatase
MLFRQSAVITLFSIWAVAMATSAAPAYKSLQDYCESTKIDTAKNCACGQATADKIMSAEEQSLALDMMTNSERAQAKMARMGTEKVRLFTEKMRRVTMGCAGYSLK